MKKSMILKGMVFGIIILFIGTSITITISSSDENIISICRNIDSKQSSISVGSKQLKLAPKADFSFSPEEPIIYNHVKFNDKSTDPEGKIVSWSWDFDDGYYSDLRNPTHCYYIIGTYNVSLKVTNDTGFSDTAQKKLVILEDNVPPFVEIIGPIPKYIEFNFLFLTIRIEFPYSKIYGKTYVIVNAWDNVGIESVTFYVDDEMRDIDYEPPYIWLWDEKGMLFPYELKVVARDFAGNEAVDMRKVWRHQIFPPS